MKSNAPGEGSLPGSPLRVEPLAPKHDHSRLPAVLEDDLLSGDSHTLKLLRCVLEEEGLVLDLLHHFAIPFHDQVVVEAHRQCHSNAEDEGTLYGGELRQ